ncbi:hypothetical protein K7I13_04250 [Brucepastera parasyntrophica]|uniref:sensor histidine kinase n=1 Tax=Brucepastera parasyntrophica TaxID=2880008 RepID=UPI00210D2965|nr:ATP-binding protein [Brucepastera parasyntrophica]ULQ60518.1 hypothetical protein K7I13_04250 [Brucepastera parasyntrophica]
MRIKPILRGPIALRLFLFNSLLIFVPVAGFFSFEAYEKALLDKLEHSLVQEGRVLSAWLGTASLNEEFAGEVISKLEKKHTSRIRIISNDGSLLADSSTQETIAAPVNSEEETGLKAVSGRSEIYQPEEVPAQSGSSEKQAPQSTFIYRLLSTPVRLYRKYFLPPSPPLQTADYYSGKKQFDGPEIRAALNGYYGSTTRVSGGGQQSITLYSAIPVFLNDEVQGAVLVSQSTYRILNDLYTFRLGIGRVFLYSLAIAIAVSLILALTISRPIGRLKKQADNFRRSGKQGGGPRPFSGSGRKDEIDTLALAFSDLVNRLELKIDWAERFSADASHELKNPLTGIRANTELLETDDSQQKEIIASIQNACGRMEKTIEGLRSLAVLERRGGHTEALQFLEMVKNLVGSFGKDRIELETEGDFSRIIINAETQNLETAVRNMLDNALSFSPENEKVCVKISAAGDTFDLKVCDKGPGIPEELREKVFERFYSNRPGESSRDHSGLGLALVRAIAENAGGRVFISEISGGPGTCMVLQFPKNS